MEVTKTMGQGKANVASEVNAFEPGSDFRGQFMSVKQY